MWLVGVKRIGWFRLWRFIMSGAEKKRRIVQVEISIGRKEPKLYVVPKEKAQGIMQILKEYEIESGPEYWVAAEDVFPDLRSPQKRPGTVLKGLRLRDELTQVELAKKLGCPQSWISQ